MFALFYYIIWYYLVDQIILIPCLCVRWALNLPPTWQCEKLIFIVYLLVLLFFIASAQRILFMHSCHVILLCILFLKLIFFSKILAYYIVLSCNNYIKSWLVNTLLIVLFNRRLRNGLFWVYNSTTVYAPLQKVYYVGYTFIYCNMTYMKIMLYVL